jgi:hypothetical protein
VKFNFKEYQRQKTKQYLKNNNFILLSVNANQKSQNWVTIEQELCKLKLDYYKIYNKTTKKVIKNSAHKNIANMISTTFFFLKPRDNQKILVKTDIFNLLGLISFTLLGIKLNKNIYSTLQLKNVISFHYRKNTSILYQCIITNFKYSLLLALKEKS